MFDNAVDDSLAVLKLIPDLLKNLFTALYGDENILYFHEDSGNVVFNFNGMVILNIDLNKINLDSSLGKDDPDAIILIRLLAWHFKFEKLKGLKHN